MPVISLPQVSARKSIQWEWILEARGDLNKLFTCREVDLAGNEKLTDCNTYWRLNSTSDPFAGTFIMPITLRTIAAYSKQVFSYPYLSVAGRFHRIGAPFSDANITYQWIGLENGGINGTGILAFLLRTVRNAYSNRLFAVASTDMFWNNLELDITFALPTDFDMTNYRYSIIVGDKMSVFKINDRVRAIVVHASEVAPILIQNGPPYGIGAIGPIGQSLTTLIEVSEAIRTHYAVADIVMGFSPWVFRAVENPTGKFSITLPIFVSGLDRWITATSITGTTTSHAFPGVGEKTLLWSSDGGRLEIQYYSLAGGWRTYDVLTSLSNVKLRIVEEAIAIRLVYTPTSTPATVYNASVTISL